MDRDHRINASIAPTPQVFPPGDGGQLGVLLLQTRFPRLAGDAGHPGSWVPGTRFHVVAGCGPLDAVQTADGLRASHVQQAFAEGARRLQSDGVTAITTSCGFLVLLQAALQAAVDVPVVTSSLLLLPDLLARGRRVGVVTISAGRLGDAHLLAAGVRPDQRTQVVVQGVAEDGEFARAILGDQPSMHPDAGRDVVDAALALKARAPDIETVVLECTNMPPHADAIRRATGFEVRSLADVRVLRPFRASPAVAP